METFQKNSSSLIREELNKKSIYPDAENYPEAELNYDLITKVIWDLLTPLTFPHCLNQRPCLAVLGPKTFLVGQVPLSPVCPMSRKVLKPVATRDHTTQWLRWAFSLPCETWPCWGPQGGGPGSCG